MCTELHWSLWTSYSTLNAEPHPLACYFESSDDYSVFVNGLVGISRCTHTAPTDSLYPPDPFHSAAHPDHTAHPNSIGNHNQLFQRTLSYRLDSRIWTFGNSRWWRIRQDRRCTVVGHILNNCLQYLVPLLVINLFHTIKCNRFYQDKANFPLEMRFFLSWDTNSTLVRMTKSPTSEASMN